MGDSEEGPRRRQEHRGDISQSLPIPLACVPFIIGRAGATIKRVAEKTGCKLHISEQAEHGMGIEWRYISVRGSIAGVNSAKRFIMMYVWRHGQLNPENASEPLRERQESPRPRPPQSDEPPQNS
jgi:hypothetical protein